MKVKTFHLLEECILSKDVNSITNKPIIPKNTVVTSQTLEILEAFLIKEVSIEPKLKNGHPFKQVTYSENEEIENEVSEERLFIDLYLEAVKEYQQLFQSWQAGLPVDIARVRALIVPLIEKSIKSLEEVMSLHRYSTKDSYFFHHSVSVGVMAGYMGKKLQYNQGDCVQLAIAGLLSDCGMAKIDQRLLLSPNLFSLAEFDEIKKHPIYSYKMLERIPLLKESVKLAVLQHHERIDGSGYSLGISGDKLHPFGKIIAVIDVYHAMCCDTMHRSKRAPFIVIEEMLLDNFGKFDVLILQQLIQEVVKISIGSEVKLSNEQIGTIIFIDEKFPTRPMVKVEQNEFIQLSIRKDLSIEEVINK